MTRVQAADVRVIVAEILAEQQRIGRDDIDAMVVKAVATTLTSLGSTRMIAKSFARIFCTCGAGARNRAGTELCIQGCHHGNRNWFCRSCMARHQGDARQMIC